MQIIRVKRRAHTQKKFRCHALRCHPYCQWCECSLTPETATTDHLVPLSRGGSNRWDNLCLACVGCNRRRKNDLPVKAPTGPRWENSRSGRFLALQAAAVWIAWTRYRGGRWRPTLRGSAPAQLRTSVDILIGKAVEVVILPRGQDPPT